ncbi:MAG: hypothetical protein IKY83_10035, partial [Proteobacteria bacterium]|nr:hypothetical protein [Pseudomonadota bacterium]
MKYEPFAAACLIFASCQPATVPAPDTDKPEEIRDAQSDWTEIPDAKISFVRMHPGAAQKNVYVDWKCFENQISHERVYRILGRDISQDAANALEKLRGSITEDLIPSDGIYACRYRDQMPQFRIELIQDAKKIQIISSSDCLHAAPFNLIVDGKYYMQTSGAIGSALENALAMSGNALHVGETEGMFMFSEKIKVDGYNAEPLDSPAKWFDDAFRKDTAFGAMLAAIEKQFGPLALPEIACNQSKSPQCNAVSARYQVKVGDHFIYAIPLKYDGQSVAAQIIPDTEWEALAKAAKTHVFQAVAQAVSPAQDIQLTWSDGTDCKMVKGLAKHFDLPESVSCSTWTFHCKDCPVKTYIYYVGLNA